MIFVPVTLFSQGILQMSHSCSSILSRDYAAFLISYLRSAYIHALPINTCSYIWRLAAACQDHYEPRVVSVWLLTINVPLPVQQIKPKVWCVSISAVKCPM